MKIGDGIVKPFMCPEDGFSLNKKPSDILICDIYRSIEGEVDLGSCHHKHHFCPIDKYICDNLVRKMSDEFVKILKGQTLKEFL